MPAILKIIAEALHAEVQTSASTQTEPFWDTGTIILCTVSPCIWVIWVTWYGGLTTLLKAPLRRNRLFPAVPLIILLVWFFVMYGISQAISVCLPDATSTQKEILTYSAMAVTEITLITAMLITAHRTFARKLKGFGLNPRTLPKDTGCAFVNLVALYPLILGGLWVVLYLGKYITSDPNFNIEEHQALELLEENQNLLIQILIPTFAVIIVPIFEEMLFRGFMQTTIRSFTGSSFIAIVLTSFIFVILHPAQHWLALMALSCGLGYAYERSGSLFRPVLMHIFFNGLSIAFTFVNVR